MFYHKLSMGAAAAVVAFGVGGFGERAEAATITTNDFVFAGEFEGNDCAGALGTPPNCVWNGSPMIAKFDFNDNGMVTVFTPGLFPSIDGSEFSFAFDTASESFSWTYTPNRPDDPGVTAFSVKGGPAFRVYEKEGDAWLGIGDFSDNWLTPLNPGGNRSGVSHIVFYDSVTPIPLPAAAWLLLSGLAGMGFLGARKRKAQTA